VTHSDNKGGGSMRYDDIIVGGGSAGAVLAARLSEEPTRRVLLVEAGPDYATIDSTPEDLQNSWRMSLRSHDWGMTAEAVPGRMIPYPRGRVIGGSSAVNAAIALRGVPADYDEWAALGNPDWSWQRVLPFFRRLEDDSEGEDRLHGRGGPIEICRWPLDELIPTQRAFFEVCLRLGFGEVIDHNHPAATGVGPCPQNRRDRLRISTALAYLLPARGRANLDVRPRSLVRRVLLEDERAVAVELESNRERERVDGRRVTLAAGAIGSPAILLRSGIGPKEDLLDLGIEPLVDLPGVGANLIDHPVTRLLLVPKPGSCDPEMPLAQVVLRYTARGSDEFNDMQQVIFSHVDVAGIGGDQAVALVGAPLAIGLPVALERPLARGRLTLASSDPSVQPAIELNFAADAEDIRRLVEGVRLAWQIAQQPEIARHADRVALLDDETMNSDESLAAYVRATVTTQFHPCGTARMGPPGDAMAVVDQQCRLRGVTNLRVVDASIMPTIPRANINLTCIMIGERVVERMDGAA
jgi:choline dehydrogenase-like flavoprotein